jgi:hypothetical protein
MRWGALLAVLLALAIGGCGGSSGTPSPAAATSSAAAASSDADTPAPSGSASDEPTASVVPDSPVAGIVEDITPPSPAAPKTFTLRTNDGVTIAFTLGPLENAADFSLESLADHQSTATPILVFFRDENGRLVVFRIEEAG